VRRRRRSHRGFTLVETIVATMLLAIGITACLSAVAVSTRVTGVGKEYSTAALLADRHFSELQSDPNMLTSGEQSGEFGAEYQGYSWNQQIEQTDFQGLLRVNLTIEWNTGSSVNSAQFTTYAQQPQTTTES
jgi:type II secretion system protein I